MGFKYQYCETDPLRNPKPTALLEANPRGLVPAIRQGGWACAESSVILEYVCFPRSFSGASFSYHPLWVVKFVALLTNNIPSAGRHQQHNPATPDNPQAESELPTVD
jgi:hypothetical protein